MPLTHVQNRVGMFAQIWNGRYNGREIKFIGTGDLKLNILKMFMNHFYCEYIIGRDQKHISLWNHKSLSFEKIIGVIQVDFFGPALVGLMSYAKSLMRYKNPLFWDSRFDVLFRPSKLNYELLENCPLFPQILRNVDFFVNLIVL